jgi:hypothetical protein
MVAHRQGCAKTAGEMHQNYGSGHETAASHGSTECSTARAAAGQESSPGDHAYLKKTFSQFMPKPRLGTCDADGMELEQDHHTLVSTHPGAVRQRPPCGYEVAEAADGASDSDADRFIAAVHLFAGGQWEHRLSIHRAWLLPTLAPEPVSLITSRRVAQHRHCDDLDLVTRGQKLCQIRSMKISAGERQHVEQRRVG